MLTVTVSPAKREEKNLVANLLQLYLHDFSEIEALETNAEGLFIMNHIRPIAICIFRHNNHILVAEGYDPVKKQPFYRPLGGEIEFGEQSEQTICREMMEEIGAKVYDLKYLGTIENIFIFNGAPGHEIVQIYDGALADAGLYEQPVILGHELDIQDSFRAVWKHLDEFGDGKSTLYPTGLLALLS